MSFGDENKDIYKLKAFAC